MVRSAWRHSQRVESLTRRLGLVSDLLGPRMQSEPSSDSRAVWPVEAASAWGRAPTRCTGAVGIARSIPRSCQSKRSSLLALRSEKGRTVLPRRGCHSERSTQRVTVRPGKLRPADLPSRHAVARPPAQERSLGAGGEHPQYVGAWDSTDGRARRTGSGAARRPDARPATQRGKHRTPTSRREPRQRYVHPSECVVQNTSAVCLPSAAGTPPALRVTRARGTESQQSRALPHP